MILPYKGYVKLTSIQGFRWGRQHKGIDLVGLGDKTIYAVRGGIVVVSEIVSKATGRPEWQMGNRIMIRGDDGVYITYQHLKERYVKENENIKKGQPIGFEGATGYCVPEGASHLHFQVQNKRGVGFTAFGAAEYLGIPNKVGTYINVQNREPKDLIAEKCHLNKNVIDYLSKYRYHEALFDKLWVVLKNGKVMPTGSGNINADLATAIARKCNLEGQTIKYIWGYSADKRKVRDEIWIPLWFNMQ